MKIFVPVNSGPEHRNQVAQRFTEFASSERDGMNTTSTTSPWDSERFISSSMVVRSFSGTITAEDSKRIHSRAPKCESIVASESRHTIDA